VIDTVTALDTNVLLDVLVEDPQFGEASARAIAEASSSGPVVVCDVVVAELRPFFTDDAELERFLVETGVQFDPVSLRAALRAGALWARHRAAGGAPRRAVADFLVAAHAAEQAQRLLTRDADIRSLSLGSLEVVAPGP